MPDLPRRKRGRPSVPKDERRSKNFTFRSRAALHEKLRVAALGSGRSVSEEIEYRLDRSFLEQDFESRLIKEVFGNRELFGMMRVIAAAAHESGQAAGYFSTGSLEGAAGWLQQPWAYDQAVQAARRVFEALRPVGEIVPPVDMPNLGHGFASGVLNEIARGLGRTSSTMQRTDELRRDLGPMADRLSEAETAKEDLLFSVQRDDGHQVIVTLTNKKPMDGNS